jgi:hypothetical protein
MVFAVVRGGDVLKGGGGPDFLEGEGGDDEIAGQGDRDTATFNHSKRDVEASLLLGTAIGEGRDTLDSIKHLEGGKGDDRLIGDRATTS